MQCRVSLSEEEGRPRQCRVRLPKRIGGGKQCRVRLIAMAGRVPHR